MPFIGPKINIFTCNNRPFTRTVNVQYMFNSMFTCQINQGDVVEKFVLIRIGCDSTLFIKGIKLPNTKKINLDMF